VFLKALKNCAYPKAAGAHGPARPPRESFVPSPDPYRRAGTPMSTEWSEEQVEVAGSLGVCMKGSIAHFVVISRDNTREDLWCFASFENRTPIPTEEQER
jgi:hypothetical protein